MGLLRRRMVGLAALVAGLLAVQGHVSMVEAQGAVTVSPTPDHAPAVADLRSAEAASVDVVTSSTRFVSGVNWPTRPRATKTASCRSGWVAVGGGGRIVDEANPQGSSFAMVGSFPSGGSPPSGWTVEIDDQRFGTGPVELTAYAVCVSSAGLAFDDTSASVANGQRPDDDTDSPRRLTTEQRQQQQRTNRSNRDDGHTEGHVIALACDRRPPALSLANRDGSVTVQLLDDAATVCESVRVGDYVEADGEKIHEQLFEATDLTISDR